MHSYKWFSNINWGPFYDEESGAHYAQASDIETLMAARGGPKDMQTIQVKIGREWRFASEIAVHNGGYSKHYHGERI